MAARRCLGFSLWVLLALATVATASSFGPSRLPAAADLLARHPSRSASASALGLERLTARLGIDLAPRSLTGRSRPSKTEVDAYDAAQREIHAYVKRQLARTDPGVAPPSAELAAFFDDHGREIEALRCQLLEHEVPRWELRLESPTVMPLPNLVGHINLQRLLAANALAQAANRDWAAASRTLEASWRLNASLADDPLLITQLVALSVARMQVGVLRHLEDVPSRWRERLADVDFRDSLLEALAVESWLWTQRSDEDLSQDSDLLQHVLWLAARPYMRMCVDELGVAWRSRLENFARLDYLCDRDLHELDADLRLRSPWWNVLSDMVPNLSGIPVRLARFELDLELTRKVLRLKAERDLRDGRWPDSLPGITVSSACPADRWTYRVEPDGAVSLAFSRPIEWPDPLGFVLPNRYEATAP